MDQLPRLGKRELICLLLFTCNYVVFVWRGFLFLSVLGMGNVILLWHSLNLPYNYFELFLMFLFFMFQAMLLSFVYIIYFIQLFIYLIIFLFVLLLSFHQLLE